MSAKFFLKLVEAIATEITARSGIVASLLNNPNTKSDPQRPSVAPTNGAITCGAGMPPGDATPSGEFTIS